MCCPKSERKQMCDKWDINTFVGKGDSTQVVLFNLWIILDNTSKERGWNVSKTAMYMFVWQALVCPYKQTNTLVNTFSEVEFHFDHINFSIKHVYWRC